MKLHSIMTPEGREQARKLAAKLEANNLHITFGGAMSLAASAVAHLEPNKYQGKLTGRYGVHRYAQNYGESGDGKWKVEVRLQDGTLVYPNMPEDLYEAFLNDSIKAMECTVIVREVPIEGRTQKFAQLAGRDWSDDDADPQASLLPPEQLSDDQVRALTTSQIEQYDDAAQVKLLKRKAALT